MIVKPTEKIVEDSLKSAESAISDMSKVATDREVVTLAALSSYHQTQAIVTSNLLVVEEIKKLANLINSRPVR